MGRIWTLWLARAGSATRVRRANRLTRHWNVALTELTLRMLRARLDVRGQWPGGQFLIVSKSSERFRRCRRSPVGLAKPEPEVRGEGRAGRFVPTISMALSHWGSALISREGTRDNLRRLKTMACNLEYWDGSVVVFPEGTRAKDVACSPTRQRRSGSLPRNAACRSFRS